MSKELDVAVAAVRLAAVVCRKVQANLVNADTLEKKDKSPVTVADFASQAVICRALHAAFPGIPVVGEEDSKDLRTDESAGLRASVAEHVGMVIGASATEAEVLDWIDHGGWTPDGKTDRYWTLDPIDGTKGFLRGEQYAIALGLIENGRVIVGILGCPNLPIGDGGTVHDAIVHDATVHDGSVRDGRKQDGLVQGVLMTAERGAGAHVIGLDDADAVATAVRVSDVAKAADARFCESVESGHSDQGASAQIASALGITCDPYRIDSQCKYAAVARGDASIYLRLPTRKDYREKIWDHAGGSIVVEEAGGTVTDAFGKPLDFSHGRTLEDNRGIIATNGNFHAEVVAAVGPALTNV